MRDDQDDKVADGRGYISGIQMESVYVFCDMDHAGDVPVSD